jgi:hypothetical protein
VLSGLWFKNSRPKTREDVNEEGYRLEYKSNPGVIITFSAVTAATIIYLIHTLAELAKNVIHLFQGGF